MPFLLLVALTIIESFPVRTVKVEVVNLEGQSKLKLVECAEEMVRGDGYDEVWCVFDMDV